MSSYEIRGSALSPAERRYLMRRPHHVRPIWVVAEKAALVAANQYPNHPMKADALRHCYGSAMLAREIGLDNAREFTSAHEDFASNPRGDKLMDLHNNAVGIRISGQNPQATDVQLLLHCKRAVEDGRLVLSPHAALALPLP